MRYGVRVLAALAMLLALGRLAAEAQNPNGQELPIAPSALIHPDNDSAKASANAAPQPACVRGTVEDSAGGLIPGAKVEIASVAHADSRTVLAGEDGSFQVNGLKPDEAYVVRVSTDGAATWMSQPITLKPGESLTLDDIHLKVEVTDSITVSASREQIATAQLQMETQQKLFGFVPNYYTVYDAENAVPLTPKLKFELAEKTSVNPVTVAGIAFVAGVKQAGRTPDYQLGAAGYGQRLGATAATGIADILIGGAVLPSVLHQDPRYFYQGTGTKKSRLMHALSYAVVTRGDNGKNEPNYSSIGGDLSTSALQLTYFPHANRTAGDFAGQFALATTERTLNAVAQEFLFARFTSKAQFHADSDDSVSTPQAKHSKHKHSKKRESE
jgi:hypothetical protein